MFLLVQRISERLDSLKFRFFLLRSVQPVEHKVVEVDRRWCSFSNGWFLGEPAVDFPRAVTYVSDQRSSQAPRSDFHLHNSLWWKLPIYRSSKRPRKFIWKKQRKTHPKINHEIFPDLPCSTFVFSVSCCNVQQNNATIWIKILRSDSPGKAWVNHARISKKSAFGISKKRKGMTIISCLNSF